MPRARMTRVIKVWELGGRRNVQLREYPFAGHLPFIDTREEFLADLLDFYDGVDGVKQSNRRGLVDPSLRAGR